MHHHHIPIAGAASPEAAATDAPPRPVLDPSTLHIHIPSSPRHALPSTPHKRPVVMNSSSSSTPTRPSPSPFTPPRRRKAAGAPAAAAARHLLRCLHLRLRILLLISLPTLYFLSPSHAVLPRSLFADFLSAAAFSCALLLLLCLSLPRLPFALPLPLPLRRARRSPILWSIGSSPSGASASTPTTGHFVQVYSNADIYEGQFHRGRCTGSGVYYYYMSGRYEGDWVDAKYDGFGVETWARGSRYRGQYRLGLRHGHGVYRFYTGDVYSGEWSNGQSHGYGVHTCEDGSRYIGEFKRGVKHGLGHYHFRCGIEFVFQYCCRFLPC
jgi:hypothetical protein